MANPNLGMDGARTGGSQAASTPRTSTPGTGPAGSGNLAAGVGTPRMGTHSAMGASSPGPGMLGLNARLPSVNEPRGSMGLSSSGLLAQNRNALGLQQLQQLQMSQAYGRSQAGIPGQQPQSHLPPRWVPSDYVSLQLTVLCDSRESAQSSMSALPSLRRPAA